MFVHSYLDCKLLGSFDWLIGTCNSLEGCWSEEAEENLAPGIVLQSSFVDTSALNLRRIEVLVQVEMSWMTWVVMRARPSTFYP